MEVGADGVAIITMNNPPVNAMHPSGARLLSTPLLHLSSGSAVQHRCGFESLQFSCTSMDLSASLGLACGAFVSMFDRHATYAANTGVVAQPIK
jgi:hypothetical protein